MGIVPASRSLARASAARKRARKTTSHRRKAVRLGLASMAIFTREGFYHEMAHVWPYMPGYFVMPAAYQEAAEELVRAAEKGPGDLLVFPIVYLYRHAIEVSMKEVIQRAVALRDDGKGSPSQHRHDLMELWRRTRALLMEIVPDEPYDGVDEVQAVIRELHDLDERSMSFRYDDQKIGERLHGPANVPMIGQTLGGVVNWLAGASDMLDALRTAQGGDA